MIIVLLILSIAPIIIFANMIYKRDFDKEPKSLLAKLFLCGIGSTFLTLMITKLLSSVVPFFGFTYTELNAIELIPYVFIGVALIEEFSKWIFVYKLEYNDNEFNHLYDGIVYAAFVSLGFACFENILYVMQSGITTAILRAFLAIPGHLCDGIMMGYYLSMAKLAMCNNHKDLSKKNLILSLIIPTVAHGIYDYLIFASTVTDNSLFIIAFFIFIVFFFTYASKKVKQLSLSAYNLNPNYIPVTRRNTFNMNYQQPNNMYQNQMNYTQQNYQSYPQQQSYAQQTQTPTVSYAQNNNTRMKFCPYCGTPVVGKFCSKCGKQIV